MFLAKLRPAFVRQALLSRLASALRPYLARTHLIWGDRARVSIGRNVMLIDTLLNCRSGRIVIEDDVFFGHGVMLLTGKHDMTQRGAERHPAVQEDGRDIVIRRGAWIASGAILLGPCEVGENAVVGAGSVVTGDVRAGTLVTGNEQRNLRRIEFKKTKYDD
ncbi:MAG: acyltransferase [Kiloniellales bacterium]